MCSIPIPSINSCTTTETFTSTLTQKHSMNTTPIKVCVNSSIGMAKAALEAVNGMNLFGINGASWSVIYSDIDAHFRNRINFDSFLPRESASKVVGWHKRVRLVKGLNSRPF